MLVVLGAGLTAWILSERLVGDTDDVADRTGEVLVATQQVSASFAEADTAAVSVHLAGAEGNREQRRLFEQAIDRATAGLERIARLVGDDEPSHAALSEIAALTTRYSGLVESARLASVEDLAGADERLNEASAVNRDEISPRVQLIAQRAQVRFDQQTKSTWYLVAFVLLVVALATLLAAQLMLQRRFRRWINPPLALAAGLVIVLLVVSGRAFATQQDAFTRADDQAYEAIRLSERIQQTAYRYRAVETASVLEKRDASVELDELASILGTPGSGLFQRAEEEADSSRELAGTAEVVVRWNRYLLESGQIQSALRLGDADTAEVITRGPANSAFNGFNTSVEAALLDNREQFLAQLARAADSLRWVRPVVVIGSLLAAVLAWWGFAVRIGEYR